MGGRVQQKVGEFAGDAKTQAEGRYNQAAGQARQQIARLSDVIKDQPIPSALVAVGIDSSARASPNWHRRGSRGRPYPSNSGASSA
jgi:hypothetical protein